MEVDRRGALRVARADQPKSTFAQKNGANRKANLLRGNVAITLMGRPRCLSMGWFFHKIWFATPASTRI
jgi:hypothetical protein